MKSEGRVTIPTDSSFVEETKYYLKKWGADAIRDCDGTELPENPKELCDKVYKTYFLARGDNDYAYSHNEYLQNVALTSEFCMAKTETLRIDLMEDYFADQVAVNEDSDSVQLWQVFDRTTGQEIFDWKYESATKNVIIENAVPMHEYSVSFFAKTLWDATQIYNYMANGWTITKDRDIDPIFPEAFNHIKDLLNQWLKENEQINVLRLTTFFYHFFLIRKKNTEHKYFDWFGYPSSASPKMFELFEKKYGYKITIEDIVDSGYYANSFRIPSKKILDYMELVEEFVTGKVREIVDIIHKNNREAMMFLGDNWIGGEIYGEHFKEMNLDAVVGSVNSGANLRMLSEIPHVKYREARFLPYWFPDTVYEDEQATQELRRGWVCARRAILRKPVDRIGFGGYLSLAAKYPKFVESIGRICDEFRAIYGVVGEQSAYSALKVAILNAWGKKRTWMNHMVCQDAPYQKMQNYQGVLEALSGLPIDIDFINFDDVKNGALQNYDVVFNYGDEGTAFVGGENWTDPQVLENVRSYILSGGGFIGMGEPTAIQSGGRYFQLAKALGVEREMSFSMISPKWNYQKTEKHFITSDVVGEIDYGNDLFNVYALDGAEILDIQADKYMGLGIDRGHVKMATNKFGKGRCFYMTGMKYNFVNTRLLYRAMLWCAGKEFLLLNSFSSNIHTECSYYPSGKCYAISNNTLQEQKTVFYDKEGKSTEYTLAAGELLWIKE